MALGNLIQFLKKQDQMSKLNEVKQFQKIAGLLKENHSTPSTIKWNYPEVDTDSEDFYYEHNPESKDYSITVPVYGVGADGKNYKGSYTVNVPSLEGEVLDDLKVDPDEIYDVELVGEVNELHPDKEWDEEDDEEDNGQDYPSDEELFGLPEDADYESEYGDTNAMGDTDAMNVSEAGNVKGIKIEIPGNSYASDFGKAAAREVVESFGPREYRNFLEAFLNEFKKITGGV
jgi:hypothetical protein